MNVGWPACKQDILLDCGMAHLSVGISPALSSSPPAGQLSERTPSWLGTHPSQRYQSCVPTVMEGVYIPAEERGGRKEAYLLTEVEEVRVAQGAVVMASNVHIEHLDHVDVNKPTTAHYIWLCDSCRRSAMPVMYIGPGAHLVEAAAVVDSV